jgi:conjugal transfer/type IV secretion protein DotA/TraY
MQSSLSSQAIQYVSAVDGGTQPQDASGIIDAAAHQYETSIKSAIDSSSSTINGLSSVIESNLKRDGWIMMGAWYQTFAQANSQAANMANATAAGVPSTDTANLPYPQLYRKVQTVYAQQNQRDASTSTSTTLAGNLTTGMTDPKNVMSKIFPGQSLVKFFISFNSNQGPNGMTNPLIGMKNLGDYILDAGWTALGVYAGIKAIDGASKSTLGGVASGVADVATLGVAGAVKGAAQGVLEAVTPFVIMMVITLFFFGAMLSIYIPMLPFIIWFGGVVSWFAVVGEAQIAAPLWAMTHLDGDGEGMGQRSTHGYIFLLNVMFRPVFMIIGFVLGGAGVVVLGTLLNTMFGVAMQNAQYDSVTGLVSIIGYTVLYVGMCQTLCNACFGLINVVPDQVFSWIGGQMASRVGADMADTSKRNLEAGSGHGRQGASSIKLMGKGTPGPSREAGSALDAREEA